jgi:hypothetical protein
MRDITSFPGLLEQLVEDKIGIDPDDLTINELRELASWLRTLADDREKSLNK